MMTSTAKHPSLPAWAELPWPTAGDQLNDLSEIQEAAKTLSSGREVIQAHVALTRSACDIVTKGAGMDQKICVDAYALANLVTVAAGDFGAGRNVLDSLAKSSLVDKASIDDAKQRLDFLDGASVGIAENAPEPDSSFADEVKNNDELMALLDEDPERALQVARALVVRGDRESLSMALDALEQLKSISFAAAPNETPVNIISNAAATKVRQNIARSVYGIALGEFARILHKEEQAVASEGLYSSAIDELRQSVQNGLSHLRNAAAPALVHVAFNYASLLDEWEGRANEAKKIRTENCPPEVQPSTRWILADVKPWCTGIKYKDN
ncbi:Hypothetical Protein FCC1311_052442 [Hondaea fermentalgiana]|uniref:Uncharacterized protein n=1 Tax=Hondaea fermentalgiana TaxID=2315210 RepID=A0A2R5GDJ5_9STRA|nr:Hypothetical Protein FCC1311_052442 [Hondaea fermentalgiana]|eukprot:GBG29022.1 Hypothetical Protein FCC1311_052442 [Hondaea fermentalgiana]